MKNQVTVTLFLPWVKSLSKTEYERLLRIFSKKTRDETDANRAEAGRLVSALTVKREIYSFETAASDVSFHGYAALSTDLPGQELTIRVTKAGPHIQSGTRADVTYYNAVQTEYGQGVMVSQTIGHVEETASAHMTDTVTLSGAFMGKTLMSLKQAAQTEAARHDRTRVVIPTGPSLQNEAGLSL